MAVISSATTLNFAVTVCYLAPMLMGPPFRKKRKPEIGLRVYTKGVEVATSSWSPCVNSADPPPVLASRFSFRHRERVDTLQLTIVSVLVSVMGSARV